jgi:hypothetical protein
MICNSSSTDARVSWYLFWTHVFVKFADVTSIHRAKLYANSFLLCTLPYVCTWNSLCHFSDTRPRYCSPSHLVLQVLVLRSQSTLTYVPYVWLLQLQLPVFPIYLMHTASSWIFQLPSAVGLLLANVGRKSNLFGHANLCSYMFGTIHRVNDSLIN